MSAGRRPALRAPALALAGFAAVALHGMLAWRLLPPVNNDEYLPLFPLTWWSKLPEARTEHLAGYTASFFGIAVPVQAYFYVGSVKALVYWAAGLSPELPTYRAFNLALLALSVAVTVAAAARLAGGSRVAAVVCLVLLAADTPLVVLGTTDEGPIDIGLIAAALLLMAAHALAVAPSPSKAAAAGLLLFLGTWDKLNFLWFAGAAGAGLAAASLAGPPRRALRGLGLLLIAALAAAAGIDAWMPAHADKVVRGLGRSVPLGRLADRAVLLVGRSDPLGAYHRYADVEARPRRFASRAYGVGFAAACLGATVGCLGVGARRRGRGGDALTPLFLGGFLLALIAAVLETSDATASHHAILVKPFVALGLGWLAAQWTAAPRLFAAALALAACGSLYAGWRGLTDLGAAPPLPGPYQVTRNAEDAWRAAARSGVPEVAVLNWGAFYPGVVLSPPDQYWDTARGVADACARARRHERGRLALLYRDRPRLEVLRRPGPDAGYEVVETLRFDRHPGDAWIVLSLRLR